MTNVTKMVQQVVIKELIAMSLDKDETIEFIMKLVDILHTKVKPEEANGLSGFICAGLVPVGRDERGTICEGKLMAWGGRDTLIGLVDHIIAHANKTGLIEVEEITATKMVDDLINGAIKPDSKN